MSEGESGDPAAWSAPEAGLLIRLALGVASLGAAVIHAAVIGEHFALDAMQGTFFLVAMGCQAAWAMAVIASPRRWVLMAGIAGNLGIVAVWIISRTVGIPLVAAGEPEAASMLDLVATACEVVVVAGCTILLYAPRRIWHRRVPQVGALVASGAVFAVAATFAAAAVLQGSGHRHAADVGHGSAVAQGGHGSHEMVGGGDPDPGQLERIRTAMAKYEDVDVARANGWVQEHPDYPGTGAHFYRESDWNGAGPVRSGIDVADPEFLMYSQLRTGKWELVAVAYVVDQAIYPEPPDSLRGALYHQHVWNCIVDGEELEEEDYGVISEAQCEEMGGEWSPGGVWMTHVWFIDNPDGIFAQENPELV
jgi:hypothetical protein